MYKMIAALGVAAMMAPNAAFAADYSKSCSIPNAVSCTFTSNKGFKAIKIPAQDFAGIDLVDKTYNGCPKTVKVGWDSAYHSGPEQVSLCSNGIGNLQVKPNRQIQGGSTQMKMRTN